MNRATTEQMSNFQKTTHNREQALTEVVESHGASLLSAITRRIRDKIEAEDIAQEVFEEFLTAYDLNEAIESLSAWLFTVARNKILDRFRKKKTESGYREKLLSGGLPVVRSNESMDRPDLAWTAAYQRGEITEALALLPADQRDIFVKHELEGKSFQEISTETGIGVNTLLSRKRYALLFLRTQLKEIHDELK